MALPDSSLSDFSSSDDFQFGSEGHRMKTLWISVVAIVYAHTEYHVPPTVIVHYHTIKKVK